MFKETIKGATAKVFSGVKKSGSYIGGLVLQEGAAAIARRSPMLGGFADKVINNIQAGQQLNKIRTASAKNYIETADNDTSKEFKEKIKSESGAGTSNKAIEKDMIGILTKLQKLVDKNGQEETKKTEFYKTYEKYFEDYKKHEEQAIKESSKDKTTDKTSVTAENTTNVTNSTNQLDNIETNTKDTVETLTKLTDAPAKTKMSNGIMPALDQLGGQLIEKFFSEKIIKKDKPEKDDLVASPAEASVDVSKETLIEVKKTNEFLSIQNIKDEERSISEKETLAETRKVNISSVLNTLTEKLASSISSLATTLKETLENRLQTSKSILPDLDIDIDRNKPSSNKKGKQKHRPTRARSLSPVTDKIASVGKAESIVPDLTDAKKPSAVSGGRFSSLLSGARGVAGAAASYAMPALAVGAAGALGYGTGTVLNSGISSGLSSMTGSETTLGGWLYDKFNDDPNSPEAQAKYAASPEGQAQLVKTKAANAARSVTPAASVTPAQTAGQTVAAASAALNSKEAIAAKPAAPIIITNNNTTSGGSSGGGGVVVASPVRNTESTFERVQMQDFWPRAA